MKIFDKVLVCFKKICNKGTELYANICVWLTGHVILQKMPITIDLKD